ncbi:hypothetical protein MAFF212519_29160 [Clavibacter michiganensis]
MTAMTTPEAPAEPAPASRARAIDARQLAEALPGAFRKLDPRLMWRNPVMLIVEVGAAFTTVLAIAEPFTGGAGSSGGSAVPATFTAGIALWLWLTVVFANLAESVAEGRGKAQADSLRKTRTSTMAHVVASYDASGDPGAERAELREVSSATSRSATWSSWSPASRSRATATSCGASPPSTSRPSRASPRRWSASPAATAAPSRAALGC